MKDIAVRTLLPTQRHPDFWGPAMALTLAHWAMEPERIACVADMMSLMLRSLFLNTSHRMTVLALFGDMAKAPALREADRLQAAHARHDAIRKQWRHPACARANGA